MLAICALCDASPVADEDDDSDSVDDADDEDDEDDDDDDDDDDRGDGSSDDIKGTFGVNRRTFVPLASVSCLLSKSAMPISRRRRPPFAGCSTGSVQSISVPITCLLALRVRLPLCCALPVAAAVATGAASRLLARLAQVLPSSPSSARLRFFLAVDTCATESPADLCCLCGCCWCWCWCCVLEDGLVCASLVRLPARNLICLQGGVRLSAGQCSGRFAAAHPFDPLSSSPSFELPPPTHLSRR